MVSDIGGVPNAASLALGSCYGSVRWRVAAVEPWRGYVRLSQTPSITVNRRENMDGQ
jgi:hypothetical protein